MQQRSIDLAALFKYSFRQYKKYLSFIIGIMVTYYVLGIIPQVYLVLNTPADPSLEDQILSGILMVTQLFLSLGFIKIMLLLIDGEHVEVADMFNNSTSFLNYFIAYFLYMLAVFLGTLLFIVPGIFVAVRLQFYPYFILEGTASPISALQKSYKLTEELMLELFLFGIAVIALNIGGVLLFGIGIIFTYPLTTMATAILYKSFRDGSDLLPSAKYRA